MSSKCSYNYEMCSLVSLTLPGGQRQSWSAIAICFQAIRSMDQLTEQLIGMLLKFCAASLAGWMVESDFSFDAWDEVATGFCEQQAVQWSIVLKLACLFHHCWCIYEPHIPVHHFPFNESYSLQCTLGPSLCHPLWLLGCYYRQWFCDIHEGPYTSSNHSSKFC